MLDKIKKYLMQESSLYTILFAALGIGEQVYNGLYGGKFNITDLFSIYGFIISHLTIKYAADSKYNTNTGEKP